MKQNPPTGLTGLTRALLLLWPFWFSAAPARSAISFADIQLWAGAAPGPAVNSAAMVIDWRDGSPGLVWGYRWPASERRTGQDMLLAVLGADARLNIDSAFFPNAISWEVRTRSFDNNGTPADFMDDRYWGYWVNNNVFFHPTDFNLNSHIVPPAEVVVPLGNPFAGGPWVESITGSAGRELADGSWDGWAFGPFLTQPLEPVPAPVPEPGGGTLVFLTAMALLRRRRVVVHSNELAQCVARRSKVEPLEFLPFGRSDRENLETGCGEDEFGKALCDQKRRWGETPSSRRLNGAHVPISSHPINRIADDARMGRGTERALAAGPQPAGREAPRRLRPRKSGLDGVSPHQVCKRKACPLDGRKAQLKPPVSDVVRVIPTSIGLRNVETPGTRHWNVELRRWWNATRLVSAALLPSGATAQGPLLPDPAGPVPAASPRFKSWAESVESFQPGPQRLWESPSVPVSYGSPASVTGPADTTGESYPNPGTPAAVSAPLLSLGDGGRITLRMARPMADGQGADFVVFENAVAVGEFAVFAELAFVEVSSNGTDFVRFPAQSLTPVAAQISTFGTLDPRLVRNLAGKAPVGFGTPFDLGELADAAGLDRQRVTHVRIIDVVGDVYSGFGSRDSEGRWINDPYPTPFATGGFDLDAVGVIHEAAADGWDDWRAGHFSAAELEEANVSGASADPDGDSQPNIFEYALRRDPRVPDFAAAVTVEATGSGVTVRFARMAERTDVTFALEHSTDGAAWDAIAASTSGAPAQSLLPFADVTGEEGSALVIVSVSLPAATGRMFYRLRVSRVVP